VPPHDRFTSARQGREIHLEDGLARVNLAIHYVAEEDQVSELLLHALKKEGSLPNVLST